MNLDVLIPSLLLPAPISTLIQAPHAPTLTRLLARADRQIDAPANGTAWLCERWGLTAPYPLAPLLAEFDGIDIGEHAWLLAEPVNLVPDRDTLKMFPAHHLELTAAEADAFIAALNAHFHDVGLVFFAPTPSRWYARCAIDEVPETTHVDQARVGRLLDLQPKSRGKINWRALQNEIQMLFHTHPVNALREDSGRPVVSGVWFYGGGMRAALKAPQYETVLADAPLPKHLAQASGMTVGPVPIPLTTLNAKDMLVAIHTCADLTDDFDLPGLTTEIERLERDWFAPLAAALGRGDIATLKIIIPNGLNSHVFTITQKQLMFRFWRKAEPLASYA